MKNYLKALFLVLTLNVFSLSLYIPNIGMKSGSDFYIGEVITLFLIGLTCYKVITKKEILSTFRKHYLKWLIVLITIMFIELGYRLFKYGFSLEYTMNFRFVLSHLFIVLIFTKDMINRKVIDYTIIGLFTIFTIYQLVYFGLFMTIRSSKLLGNVNIYLGLLLIMVPYLIYYLSRHKEKNYLTYVVYIGLLLTYFLVPFSGSRSGFFTLSAAIIVSVVIFNKTFSKQRILTIISMIALGLACTFTMPFITKSAQQVAAIERATKIHISIENTVQDPKLDGKTNIDDITGEKSDNLRAILWEKSIEKVKKDPIMGYGKTISESTLNGYVVFQRPHNFILEYILIFGLIGTPVYVYLLTSSGVYDVRQKIKNKQFKLDSRMLFFGLQLSLIGAFSFFQPTLNTAIIVQILTLSFISLYYEVIYKD